MSDQALVGLRSRSQTPLKKAVYQSKALSKQELLGRMFAAIFDNLVYPQIWEDAVVGMAAMQVEPGQHIVTIASGGCNAMSYLTANPGRITAVDLNPAHLALTELKSGAARSLSSQEDYRRFFAPGQNRLNAELYELFLEPNLGRNARSYTIGTRAGRTSQRQMPLVLLVSPHPDGEAARRSLHA